MRIRSLLAHLLLALLLLSLSLPHGLAAGRPGPASPAPDATGGAPAYRKDKLHPALRRQVDEAPPGSLHTVVIQGRGARGLWAMGQRPDEAVAALKAAAARSQGPILSYLRARGAQVLSQFWLIDAVVARVDLATLQGLTRLPEVTVILDNFAVAAPPVARTASSPGDGELTWGLQQIEGSRVWGELGFDGSGIRVAVLDTGVDISHPDLAGKMHSDNPGDPAYPGGWIEFDESGRPVASNPHDSDAHGTHVSGTVLGGGSSGIRIGVAPGAVLMHGLVLPGGGGSFAQVVAGMQWAVEPTDSAGNPAGQRAHIASMSFGAMGLRSEVIEPIRNMYHAGVLPIAAIGNCGERCVGSPGAVFEAFGIGATEEDDAVAAFSSGDLIAKRGWESPAEEWPDEWIKPDLSAPGVRVLSAVPGGGYESWAGTSMATPHVAGAAALMLSANPGLSPALLLQTLAETSFFDDRYGEARPNLRYGWGRINAFAATAHIAYNSGIRGVITDGATGAPLDQATIRLAGTGRTAQSGPDGSFSLVLPEGLYDLTVERFGYAPAAISGVTVAAGAYATVSAALLPLPTGEVMGTVSFSRTGYGIPGVSVRVTGIPIRTETLTDADGAYRIRLPVGSYRLSYSSHGFAAEQRAEVAIAAESTALVDVALDSLPRVAVVGDVEGMLSRFLSQQGFLAEPVWWEVADQIGDYSAVVVNLPFEAMGDQFTYLVDAAAAHGVGMLFTKGYWYGWGIDLLHQYYGDPGIVGFDWDWSPLYLEVSGEQPDLLPGRTLGERFMLMDCCPDIGWFDGYSGSPLLNLHSDSRAFNQGAAYRQNETNRHVLLASFGVNWWQGPAQWTPPARQFFADAIRWVAKPEGTGPKLVRYNLTASPQTALWYQSVAVSVGVKNVGDQPGMQPLMLAVGDQWEEPQWVELNPGEYQTFHFIVQREPVGTYKVTTGHLSTSFRVRAPRVSLSASSLYVPPSGKGRNADPGEPAIPLIGAQVDLVRGGKVISRGKLDAAGSLTFDSTASRDAYTIVVRHLEYGYNKPRHYLLTLPVSVEDDTAFDLVPTAADVTELAVTLGAKGPSHHGSLFLSGGALGRAAFQVPAGTLVVTPGAYRLANVMAYDVPGAQWAYASEWEEMLLAPGPQRYQFGGDLALQLGNVRGQAAPRVHVSWQMVDGYGHRMAGLYRVTAGAFGPTSLRVIADAATWPATVAATASALVRPVLTLTNPAGAIEQTGSIGWAERPRLITMETAQVRTGQYGLALEADTGPYMGLLRKTATLQLPARALSRTLLMPGDSFDVTVEFDAGSAGEMTLAEQLPPGFQIIKQSSLPVAQYRDAIWTWQPTGRNAYRSGQTVRVTYTVRIGADAAAGTYALTGAVLQGSSSRLVAGPQSVQVVR